MARITFENGTKVDFEGDPTPDDIDYVASQLGIQSTEQVRKKGFLEKTGDIVSSIFRGRTIGEAIGTKIATAIVPPEQRQFITKGPSAGQVLGDVAQSAAFIASAALPIKPSLLRQVAQFGKLGALSGGAQAATQGGGLSEVAEGTVKGGVFGSAAGGIFGLLGKGISAFAKKAGPTMLSFTSGVPTEAITEAARNPTAAKEGLKMSLSKIHEHATGNLQSLYKDLGKEFSSGLDSVIAKTGQTKAGVAFNEKGFLGSANRMKNRLTEFGREFAREFRVGTRATGDGIELAFEKSPIVKPGEQRNVQEVFRTISTWDDFSAKGMQDLAERVGALRNFESGARTESSAIISKVYNKIAGTGGVKGLIPEFYPDLAKLRTNYAKGREVLDEIQNVLNATSEKPTQIQSAIGRLDTLFKENRETYLNVVRELATRSGVDFLALLAGTEFQKVLPNFIRGLGGGAAVSVGGAFLNPFLFLLAPLFSPRAVGKLVRNAPAIAQTSSTLARFGTTQASRLFAPTSKEPVE